MKKAILALAMLTTVTAATNPAMAKGHGRRGRPEPFCGPYCSRPFPYAETAVALATAFAIIHNSFGDSDSYYPAPPLPPPPAYPPIYHPQSVVYPAYPPAGYSDSDGWEYNGGDPGYYHGMR